MKSRRWWNGRWRLPGSSSARFLSLPREVLISTLQDHQRYFALEDDAGALLPWFITISNIDSPDPDVVRAGNERVVRPRLADAAFFWEQDRRQPLAARRGGLDAVTFQAQLGSQGARTDRIAALASSDRRAASAPMPRATARAAQLAKCDLLTRDGRASFRNCRASWAATTRSPMASRRASPQAIRDHYLPRGAGDALPASAVGDAVALADKLDTLAGIFAIGQKPSGTRDPFGLRRAAIGVLRIVLEHRLELDLIAADRARGAAAAAARHRGARRTASAREIYDFVMERLRAQYLERAADSGISTEMFDAVLATRPARCWISMRGCARWSAFVAHARKAPAWRPPTSASPTSCANRTRRPAAAAAAGARAAARAGRA